MPGRGLDVDLAVAPGEVVAVLGENGAGKSTLLQAVAGLLPTGELDGAHVVVDGADVTREPPRRRRVAWLSQRPLLFEHLSVVGNVAFGPRARGERAARARRTALGALDRVGATDLAGRAASALSGGQAQRASLARALATDPRVLLLDEPLASLDVAVAQQVRTALHDAQRARPRTTLLVTHDLLDVLVLADRAVVLEDGRVVEDGPAGEVLTRPRSRFAARLAGVNLLAGTLTEVGVPGDDASAGRSATVAVEGGAARVVGTTDEDARPGADAVAVFGPRAVAVHRATPEGSPRNAYAVEVTGVEPHGPLLRVWGHLAPGHRDAGPGAGAGAGAGADKGSAPRLAADLTPPAVAELRLVPGERAWFVVKAAEVSVHVR
ncbi:sulfate/molybdate ABC transporter ATP-binding protein [Cellulosimicrobium sp. CUA-896]|uniref:sulfate/molybdate ABC transporter ATP-binding protein n=1 Tax=Cellulosimicrobium sp. CUA-896 TaxID=1517881 RepID=UPI00210106A6|nr:ATP-binding cassette domain-containing protein [Cellulosimicrobium sp. CUA-896]